MFINIEGKLKTIANINCICGLALAILLPAFMIATDDDLTFPALLTAIIIALFSLIQSWLIYALAELLENSKQIKRILQIVYKDDIAKEVEREKQIELEKTALEAKCQKEAAPVATHYWDKTPEEEEEARRKRAAKKDSN